MNNPVAQAESDHLPEGLVRIHPSVDFTAPDPQTGETLKAVDWIIPGLWALAKMQSADGKSTYWMDFPYSLGLLAPSYIQIETDKYFSPQSVEWYAIALQRAWVNRVDKPVNMRVVKFRETRKPVLLNCLYPWHGDAVSLLLRSKALHEANLDVIALIGPSMERLLPKFIAEAWIVEAKNDDLTYWNEAIGRRIKQETLRFEECYIPRSFKPAHSDASELKELSGVAPFKREDWAETLLKGPVITFIMREDRCWAPR